jgi:hypothetical protein
MYRNDSQTRAGVSRNNPKSFPAAASLAAKGRGLLLASAILLAACRSEDAGGPAPVPAVSCPELADSLFPADKRNGLAQFKVVRPDGGESFKVGGEMRVIVSGADYTSALVDLVVFGPGGGSARVPGAPPREAIDPRERCEFRFAVPESVTTALGRTISLVSDSVKVRISDYTFPEDLDYSDGFFSVTR